MAKREIEFVADKIVLRGPMVDGGFAVTFYTGEYEQEKVAELMKIPQQTPVGVRVEVEDGEGKKAG